MFETPGWEWVGENRFDDPIHLRGGTEPGLFRVIYCASSRAGAFGETIAHFRKSVILLSGLRYIEDDDPLAPDLVGGLLPEEWRLNRRIGSTQLNASLKFANLENARSATLLRREMAPLLAEFGLEDLDFGDLLGRDRRITQNAARCVYRAADDTGAPVFAGIRYASRLNVGWELWAVFADRMVHEPGDLYQTISKDDPDLRGAAELLDIEVL